MYNKPSSKLSSNNISIYNSKIRSAFHAQFCKDTPSRCLAVSLFPFTKRNHFSACIYVGLSSMVGSERFRVFSFFTCVNGNAAANNVQTLRVLSVFWRTVSLRPHSNLLMPKEILPQPPSLAARTFHGLKRGGVAKAKLDWELTSDEKARTRKSKPSPPECVCKLEMNYIMQ
jgi:hypothetical protein